MEYFVSASGNDDNPGTLDHPFRTIKKGVSVLTAGDTLSLRQGIYVEPVTIGNKTGTSDENIVIRSFPGEHACIDGSLPLFRKTDNWNWRLAPLDDPQAHPDEYISTETFTSDPVNRGAFVDDYSYTRLVTYSNLNYLRSDNETFDLITDYPKPDLRPGPEVIERCNISNPEPECVLFQDSFTYKPGLVRVECTADDPDSNCIRDGGKKFKSVRYRRPWVYMGPGLWFNPDTHKVYIRLSHTHNHIPGLLDYTGETDPNKVRLAISPKSVRTLVITASQHVRLENLSIRFGGDEAISLPRSEGIVFDHVRIWASRFGVRMGGEAANPTTDTVFRHCEFDGGLPSWYFRTDRKSGYFFVVEGKIVENNLGGSTLDALLVGNPNDIGTHIHHCEFHDAHDMFLHGTNLTFHHNWIHNLNDEGLFLDAGTPDQPQVFRMKIFQNLITKTLSAISFAGNHPKGNWYIYRNLIDLRHTFNNIFIAVNPDAESDRPITFLPTPTIPGSTDGNDYHRIGLATRPLFRFLEYSFAGDPPCPQDPNQNPKCEAGQFDSLTALRGDPNTLPIKEPSRLFEQNKSQYPPGYESNSIEADPLFCRISEDGSFHETDDLRLCSVSPAIGAGVRLPDDLYDLDPFAPASGKPDIGCCPSGACPLQVGVDSRRSYPVE